MTTIDPNERRRAARAAARPISRRRVAVAPATKGDPGDSASRRSSRWVGSSRSGSGSRRPTRDQDEAVRLLYVHVPTIWIAYLAFVVTAVSSALYLFTQEASLGWDRLAGASAEIGVVFVAVTLVVGAMWGRLTWGVFWQWDARLTTTALLFVTYIGYLAVRGSVAAISNGPGAAPCSACSPSCRSRSCTGASGCGAACTRRPPCSTPTATSTWTA